MIDTYNNGPSGARISRAKLIHQSHEHDYWELRSSYHIRAKVWEVLKLAAEMLAVEVIKNMASRIVDYLIELLFWLIPELWKMIWMKLSGSSKV